MKYIVLIGDGMADRPLDALGGSTVLQHARTPHMDRLARGGTIGMVKTIPDGFPPGSDVANLSIMGYDPALYYTGRAPLEAVSMGIDLGAGDVAYRCNLVTLVFNGDQSGAVMLDYSSDHITTEESRELIGALNEALRSDDIVFYPGVSYRHLMIWRNGRADGACTPPHDIQDRPVADYLPSGEGSDILRSLMERSVKVLAEHPVNERRKANGKRPATSIWLWGQGLRPSVPTYRDKYGIAGALISAVDLTKGLGIAAGFEVVNVPGATGWIDTNYRGKAEAAIEALNRVDLVYVHVEAPDEAGHSGALAHKLTAIEDFDARIVGPIVTGLEERAEPFRILLMPDHATPLAEKTHTREPVPFVIYDSRTIRDNGAAGYDETIADRPGITIVDRGHALMDQFIKGGKG
jgi:2,3-bisphosphoglycerate-independent phosphoglycerate mutase